jgi:thiol-disulfide isomerase/thioredoxin
MTTTRRLATVAILPALLSACSPIWSVGDRTARPAPEISASAWINSTPIPLASLRGKVALVEFWTFSCPNCRKVQSQLEEWHREYGNRGLVVIGVLTPETEAEQNPATVEEYARKHGISYPVAVDTALATWRSFDGWAWPTMYLVDKRGVIRLSQVGEGSYGRMEAQIQALLAEDA